MFDTYNYSQSDTQYVPYEKTVTINRAPTDASIKLYDDMVEKAERAFLDRFRLNSTDIDIVVAVFDKYHLADYRVHYAIRLNGKVINDGFDVMQPYRSKPEYRRDAILSQLFDEVSRKIASEILMSAKFQTNGVI